MGMQQLKISISFKQISFMKLNAGTTIAFVCFTMLTASAQITPAKAKADSFESFKTKISKITDDYDYFSKTIGGGKNNSASFKSMVAFAELDSFLDASLSWKAQRNNTDIFVTTASPWLIPITMMVLL